MPPTRFKQTNKQDPGLIVEAYDAAADGSAVVSVVLPDGTVLLSLRDDNALDLGGPIVTKYAGTPETHVTAPPGSLCVDTTNGVAYMKKTGTSNTGWKLVTQAA